MSQDGDSVQWKGYHFVPFDIRERKMLSVLPLVSSKLINVKEKLLRVHGTVYYEFLHRSRLDTPYVASNMQQHTEQVALDVLYKDKYPIRININSRQSNLPFFKNYLDVNFRFNPLDYSNNVKQRLIDRLTSQLPVHPDIRVLETTKSVAINQYESLVNWTKDPRRMEEISKEKEARLPMITSYREGIIADEEVIRRLLTDSLSKEKFNVHQLDTNFQKANNLYNKDIKRDSGLASKQVNTHFKADTILALLFDSTSKLHQFSARKDSLTHIQKQLKKLDTSYVNGFEKEKLNASFHTTIDSSSNTAIDSLQQSVFRKDSVVQNLIQSLTDTEQKIKQKQHQMDSLQTVIASTQQKMKDLQSQRSDKLTTLTDNIYHARSASELQSTLRKQGTDVLSKKDAFLLSISQLGIGRSLVSYSELTVKNISLTGLNVEYKNRHYAALAVGTVDYRFRDFIFDPSQRVKQRLLLGRYGVMPSPDKSFIFTAYTGERQNYVGAVTTSSTTTRIMGYGVEASYRLNKNLDATFEVVKSSTPYNGLNRSEAMNKAFVFNEHSNEALFVKVNSAFPTLHSFFNVYYRKTGVNFQSYSIFNSGSRQEAWGIKWQQYLLKKQVIINSQLRRNDFDNPLLTRNYNTRSIVKSVQVLVRKRKWPVLSMGYMPATQLTKNTDGVVSENLFYTLNSSATYSYRVKRTMVNSSVVYSKFNTKGTDSGFTFFGAQSVSATNTVQLQRIALRSNVDWYTQPGLTYYTLSQDVEFQAFSFVQFDVGVKYALTDRKASYWGGVGDCRINSRKMGTIQMRFERGFLPDYSRMGLLPNNWGSVSWYKSF